MVRAFYDADADLRDLEGQRVGVIGYGIQGRAQALNLRDSGVDVVVGNREDGYADRARDDGFRVESPAAAAAAADLVTLLIPDEAQPEVFREAIAPGLEAGDAVVFAHGFAVRFDLLDIPPDVDVLLLAPRLPGQYVRERYLAGSGVPAYVDVDRDATGDGWARLLALAKGVGATRAAALTVSFREETELDLFSEQFTLPLIFRILELAFEELVSRGYPREAVIMELHGSGELGQVLVEAARVGLYRMLEADGSPACRYGVLTRRPEIVDPGEIRELARGTLERIRDGSFARELLDEQSRGHPRLESMTSESQETEFAEAEASLRDLLRTGPGDDRDDDGTG